MKSVPACNAVHTGRMQISKGRLGVKHDAAASSFEQRDVTLKKHAYHALLLLVGAAREGAA